MTALPGVDGGPSTLLLDLRAAGGRHGQRGIGRYVRGLAACVLELPTELRERVWVLGTPGAALSEFGSRTVALADGGWMGRVPPWIDGPIGAAWARWRSGAATWHATDPQRPSTDSSTRRLATVYDLIPLRDPAVAGSWRWDHRMTYRRYLREVAGAERVVAISRTTADDVESRLGIAASRIDIVYPVVQRPPRRVRESPVEPTFLMVGALDPHKQPELAVAALERFRSRERCGRLRLIGPADPARVASLERLASDLGVRDAVAFEGRVGDDALEDAFASATALLVASKIEGFGLPAVEAVLRGLPVVAVDTAAARETLDGAATLVPADPEALAAAMARAEPPSDEIVEQIARRFSVEAGAAALAASYRRVLD